MRLPGRSLTRGRAHPFVLPLRSKFDQQLRLVERGGSPHPDGILPPRPVRDNGSAPPLNLLLLLRFTVVESELGQSGVVPGNALEAQALVLAEAVVVRLR
jgi:hypothetical protein